MKRVLVCQHVPFEILGTLNPLLKEMGCRIRYVNFGRHPDARPRVDGYDGLILLGGPMSAKRTDMYPHLKTEMRLVERAIERDIPVLGICLGAQLIARALGAVVRPNAEKEIGWYGVSLTQTGKRDPVLHHFRAEEKIFQWHGDTFDIPHGAQRLASSELCTNQAFRYGHQVYGFQFHLEVDEPLIHRWLRVPIHRAEIESLKGRIDPEIILRQTTGNIHRARQLSRKTFGEFLKLIGPLKRRQRLSSR